MLTKEFLKDHFYTAYFIDNNRENMTTITIFDNYIEITAICDHISANSEIQDYLNNN